MTMRGDDEAIAAPLVTFIIITKNEEERVGECLDSVMISANGLSSSEVVLVDSRSTDSTVDIAKGYPITIIRLAEGIEASPSAGRAAGTQLARGQYIMYVDGDMILNRQWVPEALAFMQSNGAFGALYGRLVANMDDIQADSKPAIDSNITDEKLSVSRSYRVAGAFMVRRNVLEAVGGLNPYLTGDEEAELSYRINASGFSIGTTHEIMAVHPPRRITTIEETMRRYRHGYFKGQGRVLRVSIHQGRDAFRHHLWRLKAYEAYSIWMLVGLTTAIALILESMALPMILWALGTFGGILFLGLRHGMRDVPRRLLSSFFVAIGFIQVAFEKNPSSADFPDNHDRLQ